MKPLSDKNTKIRILLISPADSMDNVPKDIERYLSDSVGFELVGSFGTGLEGVDSVDQQKPDVVLIDRSIREDDVEILKIIKRILPDTVVIMMSVSNEPRWLKASFDNGADNFLTKPIDKDELLNTIHVTCARRKSKD